MKRSILALLFGCVLSGPRALAIIGGRDISEPLISPANSVVALQLNYTDEEGHRTFKRGSGVLIGKRTVLTAGHNLFYMKSPHDVEVIFSTQPCWGVNICNERRIFGRHTIMHPYFRNDYPSPPVNDVALLVMEEDLPVNYAAAELPVDRPDSVERFQAFGFGMSHEKRLADSDFRLRTLEVALKDPSYAIGSAPLLWIDQSRSGICGGDSGGPLFLAGSNRVLGIVSYTDPDPTGQHPCLTSGAFSDVSYFMPFIAPVLRKLQHSITIPRWNSRELGFD